MATASKKQPSLKQMICRAGMEHKAVLKATAENRVLPPYRAYWTAYSTLIRWGAIANGKLTTVGNELLASLTTTQS